MKKVLPSNAVLIPDNAERVFKGQIFDVYQWTQKMFDDSDSTFEMLRRPDTVNAICIVDDKILIQNEEQPHHGKRLNFPIGRVDPSDNSTLSAAQREVLEETGYTFSNWRLVDVIQPHGKLEWFIYTYLAEGVISKIKPKPDSGEKIEVRAETFDTVKKLSLDDEGFLGEAKFAFKDCGSIDELKKLPEFEGKEVDR